MNRFRGSIFIKSAAFVLQQVFFVIIAITTFVGVMYWNYDAASFDIIEQDDFTKTNYYKRLVEEKIYDLIDYIEYCNKFQVDGMDSKERVVDIYDYVQNDRITGETTISFGYKIGDLIEWKEEGFSYVPIENPNLPKIHEFPENIEEYELEELFSNTAGVAVTAYAVMEEQDIETVYTMLEKAAEKLAKEYLDYKTQVSSFKENNTNLRYAAWNVETGQLYTNMEISSIEEGWNRIENEKTYVLLDSTKADFRSNIFYTEDSLNTYLNNFYMGDESYIIAIGVDTNFPVLDSFHKEEIRYNNFEKWFDMLYRLLLSSIVGYIVCFIYQSYSAGYRKGRTLISMTPLEKIYVEILLLCLVAGELYTGWQIRSIMNGFTLPTINLTTIVELGVLSMLAGILLTTGYLSLLRRVKGKCLWKSSLLYQICDLAKQVMRESGLWIKTLIVSGILVAVTVTGSVLTGELLAGFVVLALEGTIGYFMLRSKMERKKLLTGTKSIANGDLNYQIDTRGFGRENKLLGETINQINHVLQQAVEDSIKSERLKTNLITNVSHDIKTPLTSIVNYVDLLKDMSHTDEKAVEYIRVLDEKAQKLRKLTEDLVEASKISSGNISLEMTRLNMAELVKQTSGEFFNRFQEKNLTLVTNVSENEIMIQADGSRIWRVLENIYTNAYKYSLPGTRVFAELKQQDDKAVFTLKNVSAAPLGVSSDELMKRFVRGDESRTTEGSGLGLSIAGDLIKLHNGLFEIILDGDLFVVKIQLDLCQ